MKKNKTTKVIAVMMIMLLPSLAGAELILYLDARDPGADPNTQWKDLSGNNQAFTAATSTGGLPVYNAASGVYEFGRGGQHSWFASAAADEDRFDFPSSAWSDTPDPNGKVTIVVHMATVVSSWSGSPIVSKGNINTADSAHQWVKVVADGTIVPQMEIGLLPQSGDRAFASGGTGDPAGSDLKLLVFHFDGQNSASDGDWKCYYNGGTTNVMGPVGGNANWGSQYFGNDEPLRIGSALGTNEDSRFFGDIRSIEIWSGDTCYQGMSPADYSAWRGANLDVVMVPEPATLCLLSLGSLSLLRRRRSK